MKHGMTPLNPGRCVMCGVRIPDVVLLAADMRDESADLCGSPRCRAVVDHMSPNDLFAMIEARFVANEARDQYILMLRESFTPQPPEPWKDAPSDHPTHDDYMRPMGAEPVFKPMKPSASIFIAGETDEEVAQHVLMVCWGTAAK